jgi:hypothetical protein
MGTTTIVAGVVGQQAGAKTRGLLVRDDGRVVVDVETALPVSGQDAGGQPHILTTNADGALSGAYRVALNLQRPVNTTAYTANDVVGTATGAAFAFNAIGPAGGHILLTTAKLEVDISSVPAGMTSFRLYLYTAAPPSNLADNAAWDLPAGDRTGFVGYVDLGSPADLGSTCYTQIDAINKHIKLADGSASLWGYLVTNGGFTPGANSELYVLTLHAIAV